MLTSFPRSVLIIAAVAGLCSCTSGPDYRRPAADGAAGWKEGQGWRPAQPQDALERGAWWSVFQDAELDALAAQVAVSNQNLRAAEAAWRQAGAVLAGGRSGLMPTVGADVGAQRTGHGAMSAGDAFGRHGGASTSDRFSLEGTVSWSPDLWGRLRRTIEGAAAGVQASAADLAGARLAAQTALVMAYINVAALDEEGRLLETIAVADERALDIVRNQHAAGLVPRSDVLQAESQVAGVRAQLMGLGVQRAQYEHAIAVLIGRAPSGFALAPRARLPLIPEVPLVVPSALLERRPDIAAAERRMAMANAQIGIAEAAYYPDLTLSGALGFSSAGVGSLVQAPSLLWSMGAQVAGTIFDGGARDAKVELMRAAWDQTVANYRQTVLTAFQQVEDELAATRILADQATIQARSSTAADEAARIILNQYQAGTITFTPVIVAQNAATTTRLGSLQIQTRRTVSAVALIAALGGGWQAAALSDPAVMQTRRPEKTP